MTADWDPSNYGDSYRGEVEQLIEAKRRGKAVVATAPEESPAPVVDLMAALEASVRKVGSSASGRGHADEDSGRPPKRQSSRARTTRRSGSGPRPPDHRSASGPVDGSSGRADFRRAGRGRRTGHPADRPDRAPRAASNARSWGSADAAQVVTSSQVTGEDTLGSVTARRE